MLPPAWCASVERPGGKDDAQGLHFAGPAREVLTKMTTAMGLSRNQLVVTNVVKCRTPDERQPQALEISACLPKLDRQLPAIRPTVGFAIVAPVADLG
jgi:DNA polymerase